MLVLTLVKTLVMMMDKKLELQLVLLLETMMVKRLVLMMDQK